MTGVPLETFDMSTVSGVVTLWGLLEDLSGTPVEFKTGNWVLEMPEEVQEEHLNGKWTLSVQYKNLSNFVQVDHRDGLLDFTGNANVESHQLLSKLSERLLAAGYVRFESYVEAREAARKQRSRVASRRNPLRGLSLAQRVTRRVSASADRNIPALITASVSAGALVRNMVVTVVVAAAIVDLDLLRPMVLAVLPPAAVFGVMVFLWERANPTSRRDNI